MRRLFLTSPEPTLTWLRLSLGTVMLPHGLQKLFGWFGGAGLEGTVAFFGSQFGLPPAVTVLVILTEALGSLLLLLGLAGRFAAVALLVNMVGAIALVNHSAGYFWTDGGWEFPLFLILVSAIIAVRGSGCWSLDRLLTRERSGRRPVTPLRHARLRRVHQVRSAGTPRHQADVRV